MTKMKRLAETRSIISPSSSLSSAAAQHLILGDFTQHTCAFTPEVVIKANHMYESATNGIVSNCGTCDC